MLTDAGDGCVSAALRSLEQQIGDMLQAVGGQGFVRLNTRSPKDAVGSRYQPLDSIVVPSHSTGALFAGTLSTVYLLSDFA